MLEYAYVKGNKIPVHVNAVPNGKECNCVCPNCGEALIAKNKCIDKTNHFSHVGGNETRECRMTQLHLLAQHYFLETPYITLPCVKFYYKGEELHHGSTSTRILNSQLESRLDNGRWIADVMLETEIGKLVIEIMVTHATEQRKIDFYRKERIPTIEFDLSKLRSLDLHKVIDELGRGNVDSSWIYPWCRDALIKEYEQSLDKRRLDQEIAEKREREKVLNNRRRNALKHANKMLNNKNFTLPSITKKFSGNYQGKSFEKIVTLKPSKGCTFELVQEVYACDDYLLFKGIIKDRHLWVAYLLADEPHYDLSSLDGSVVIRYPASSSCKQSKWEWLIHPSIEKATKVAEDKFKTYCHFEFQRQTKTEELLEELDVLVSNYIMCEDEFFKNQYFLWKKWLIKKAFFTPSAWKENPSIPIICKKNTFNVSPYWIFDSWHVYICCRFAELVDQYNEGEFHSLGRLGDSFIRDVGVHKRYFSIVAESTYRYTTEEARSILFITDVMASMLQPFVDSGVIIVREGEFLRRGSLLSVATEGC